MNKKSNNLIGGLVNALFWADESLQNELEYRGWPRLSRRKSLIMANIAEGCVQPSKLARNLGITRQAVHQTLKEMQKENLVTMTPDPSDKRSIIVEFCESASEIRDSALAASDYILKELEARIGKDEAAALMEVLNKDWGQAIKRNQANP